LKSTTQNFRNFGLILQIIKFRARKTKLQQPSKKHTGKNKMLSKRMAYLKKISKRATTGNLHHRLVMDGFVVVVDEILHSSKSLNNIFVLTENKKLIFH
jgi:hypothetical protein